MSTRLARFTQKAREEPQTRFSALMGLVFDPEGLHASFERQDGRKAPGVDGVRKADYAVGLEDRIDDLSRCLRRMGYQPPPLRRVYIPKGDDWSVRWLGSRFEAGDLPIAAQVADLSCGEALAAGGLLVNLDPLSQKYLGDKVRLVNRIRSCHRSLVRGSKSIVEALIEGHLTEQQLIDAQNALDADDDCYDRDILSRLKSDGIDGKGEPLFPDLDELYELLEQTTWELEA